MNFAIRKVLGVSFLLLLVLADARLIAPVKPLNFSVLTSTQHSQFATLPAALVVESAAIDQTGEDPQPTLISSLAYHGLVRSTAAPVEATAPAIFNRYQLQPRTTQGPPSVRC